MRNMSTSVKVDQIVAFACGSLVRWRDLVPSTAVQHALALTVSKALTEKQGTGSVSCFAQDPAYNAIDKSILGELGIEVLDDPDGFIAVDDASIVISIAPDVPVKQIISDLAKPAAIIWYRVDLNDFSDSL
jgi:SRR1